MVKSGLEFFILKFTGLLQSCCCPVQKNLPRKAEWAWQVSRYLWRGSVNFKINSRPLFTIIFKAKKVNFKTRDFRPLIEWVLAGVLSFKDSTNSLFLEIAFLHFIILFEFGFYLSKAVWYFPRKEVSQTFIDRDVYPGFDGFTPCLLFYFFQEKLFDFWKVGVQSKILIPACMQNNFLLTYFPLFKVFLSKVYFKGLLVVICCIVVWIKPDISGCQQDFLVVWRWNQLRKF